MEGFFAPAGHPDSPLHRIDPGVKTISIFLFIFLISTLNFWLTLLFAAAFLFFLGGLAGISPVELARRVWWVFFLAALMLITLPFTVPGNTLLALKAGKMVLAVSSEGIGRAVLLSLRVLGAVLAINLLTATSGFHGLMKGLRELRVPEIFVQLVEFTVRYLFVLSEEGRRMMIARRARAFQEGRSLLDRRTLSVLGHLLGVLFLRSAERSERVYQAMLARGLGKSLAKKKASRPPLRDLGWGISIAAFALVLRLSEPGGFLWETLLR